MLYIILLNSSARMADLKSTALYAVIFPFLCPQAKRALQRQLTEQVTFFYKVTRGYPVQIILFQGKKRIQWKRKQQGHFNNITEYFVTVLLFMYFYLQRRIFTQSIFI